MSVDATAAARGWIELEERDGALRFRVGGAWVIATVVGIRRDIDRLRLRGRGGGRAEFDGGELNEIDTAGALVLAQLAGRLEGEGIEVSWGGFEAKYLEFVEAIRELDFPDEKPTRKTDSVMVQAGKGTYSVLGTGIKALSFFGLVLVAFWDVIRRPWRVRWTAVVHHMHMTGLNAMPIVGLLTFLIGIVLTFLSAKQLTQFGATIFVADLIGIALLRELGVLITAILVAGRSGSAFTAQLGAMRVNEEVDALQAMGLDPVEVLTVPRILALVLSLPLLSFFATMMGIFGGMLIANLTMDISFVQFITRIHMSVDPRQFYIGMMKAPVFAFIIAMIGCFEGFNVSGNAESVGTHTTRSVVESIFLVIVCDAAFAMLFFTLKL
ncbi:MAG: ABC transporter permease [Myxococcales bacterium]|nr:ABC transporter permease [Myxococcales bacterium]MCB9751093.1 ABC transporter permease [Myxococcales bacterium]